MTYFIVKAPYDECFDLFFKTELGYPNFYRVTELLTPQEQYQGLILVAPYQAKEAEVLKKITEKINQLNVKCLSFGEELETAFLFNERGRVEINPHFKKTLFHKVAEFLQLHSSS